MDNAILRQVLRITLHQSLRDIVSAQLHCPIETLALYLLYYLL